jgi:type IV secretory pathway VirB4 component
MGTINFSPITSIMENHPAGCLVVGLPGSGKTYLMTNIAYDALSSGVRVIVLDPKNDMLVLKDLFPDVNLIDINNANSGSMNPFRIINGINSNIILSIIQCICGNLTEDQLVAISPIINDFVTLNRRVLKDTNFSQLANYLYASDNKFCQSIGTMLKINEDSKYGHLLFGKNTENKDFKLKKESQIISIFGLPLPKSINHELNQEEKFSSAIVYIICKMLQDILNQNDKIPTLLIMDEAHILYSNENIAKIIDSFLVLGRSLNVCTMLASPSITHFPKGIEQLIANKFMFRMSKVEADAFLNMFDSSQNNTAFDRDSIVDYICNAKNGECFMIDKNNRGGFLKVKSNLAITTNPMFKKRK